jgi:hypothetical protein
MVEATGRAESRDALRQQMLQQILDILCPNPPKPMIREFPEDFDRLHGPGWQLFLQPYLS